MSLQIDKKKKIDHFVQNDQLARLLKEHSQLTKDDRRNWTVLFSVEGIGPQTFYLIVNYLNKYQISWEDFWVGKQGIWTKLSLNKNIIESIKKFIKEHTINSYWNSIIERKISVIFITDQNYPFLLKQIDDPPPLFFLKGKMIEDEKLPIAVIGSRKMTGYGCMVTEKIVNELVINDVVIVSGFMYGVDVKAQKTAIKQGGYTIGVLGYGFDHVFPKSQTQLMETMLESGNITFISEYAPSVCPSKGTFPRRNRIIAGLSFGVVVTEAGLRSGTQITVSYALNYGRDVFAVSGPVTSIYHEGVKSMLNQGATLVGSGVEILNNLSIKQWIDIKQYKTVESKPHPQTTKANKLNQDILDALSIMPLTTSELSKQIEAKTSKINKALALLEIDGAIVYKEGCWWRIKNNF